MAKPLLYTKEELIGILLSKQEKLGRKPKKSDMSDVLKVQYRKAFGKWCYALEAAGDKPFDIVLTVFSNSPVLKYA